MDAEFKNLSKKERRKLKKQLKAEEKSKQSRNRKIITIFLASVIGIAVISLVFIGSKSQPAKTKNSSSNTISMQKDDWIRGGIQASSSATIIEYSDFQCPACGSYYPLAKKLHEDNPSVQFIYRHFPLSKIHKNAELAANAAEAAGIQNKFWEMHDKLFEHQNDWSNLSLNKAKKTFITYAKDIGLDTGKFEQDMSSSTVSARVRDDYNSGISYGVNSTPTFFIDGKKIKNPRSLDEFENLLKESARKNS